MTQEKLSDAVMDLLGLADAILDGGMDSTVLPGFLRGVQQDTGHEPCYEARMLGLELEQTGAFMDCEQLVDTIRERAEVMGCPEFSELLCQYRAQADELYGPTGGDE